MTGPVTEIITAELLTVLRAAYALNWHGIHGVAHWERVRENGLRLAAACGADPVVVELFAFLHDIKRQNDGYDPGHGQRAALWARRIRSHLPELDDHAFEQLTYACAHHTAGLTEAEVTVQACWDADRLDLGRVDITPDPRRLCTPAAREPDLIAWALHRSQAARTQRQ